MKRLYIYALISALLMMHSCQIGKRYVRPEMELPETLNGSVADDSASLADMKWWEIYGDTTLQRLINTALENNKDINIAMARVKQMAAQKRINYANMLPAFGAKVYAEEEGTSVSWNDMTIDPEYNLTLAISWELDLWGNLRWKRDVSVAEFLASIENQRAVKMSLIAQVAQAYFELVAMDNELSIVKQTMAAREEALHLAKIRFTGGLTSETAFQQANVEYAKTKTLIPDLERKIALKENELSMLLGSFPTRIYRGALPEELNTLDSLPVGLPSSLLERRPDIRKAEQELKAANAEVGVAYTNLFPKFALTGYLGLESAAFANILNAPYQFVSASLLQPLFAFGKNRAAWRAKQAAYEASVYAYEKVVINAFRETENAIVDYYKIMEIYESRLRLEQASKTALDLAQLQYLNGVVSYLDLLDAQRSYFDAQVALSNAMRDKQIMLVNLYKALGGGWTYEDGIPVKKDKSEKSK